MAMPWSSGPRWTSAAPMRSSAARSGASPAGATQPAMPHIAWTLERAEGARSSEGRKPSGFSRGAWKVRGAIKVGSATRGGALGLEPSRLKAIPLFEKFSDEELRQIAPFAEEAHAEQGSVLVRE